MKSFESTFVKNPEAGFSPEPGLRRTVACLTLAIFLVLNLHCATTLRLINDISENDPTIYGGTEIDIVLIYGGIQIMGTPFDCGGIALIAFMAGIVDLPFSFVADTVLLPITIPWYYLAKEEDITSDDAPEVSTEDAKKEEPAIKENSDRLPPAEDRKD